MYACLSWFSNYVKPLFRDWRTREGILKDSNVFEAGRTLREKKESCTCVSDISACHLLTSTILQDFLCLLTKMVLPPAWVERYPAAPPRPRLNTILGVGSGSAVPLVM